MPKRAWTFIIKLLQSPPRLRSNLTTGETWNHAVRPVHQIQVCKRSCFKSHYKTVNGCLQRYLTFKVRVTQFWLNMSLFYLNNPPPAWHTRRGKLIWRSGSRNLQAIVWWWARAPLVVQHYQPQLSPKPLHSHNAWLCLYVLCRTPVEHKALLHDCTLRHEMSLMSESRQ